MSKLPDTFYRDVPMHLPFHPNKEIIHKDELITKSIHPSDRLIFLLFNSLIDSELHHLVKTVRLWRY